MLTPRPSATGCYNGFSAYLFESKEVFYSVGSRLFLEMDVSQGLWVNHLKNLCDLYYYFIIAFTC